MVVVDDFCLWQWVLCILALAVACSLVLFLFLFFFFFLRCVVVAKVEWWLWPVLVVVGVADGRGVCGFFCG